jgi:hypothetical protein
MTNCKNTPGPSKAIVPSIAKDREYVLAVKIKAISANTSEKRVREICALRLNGCEKNASNPTLITAAKKTISIGRIKEYSITGVGILNFAPYFQ